MEKKTKFVCYVDSLHAPLFLQLSVYFFNEIEFDTSSLFRLFVVSVFALLKSQQGKFSKQPDQEGICQNQKIEAESFKNLETACLCGGEALKAETMVHKISQQAVFQAVFAESSRNEQPQTLNYSATIRNDPSPSKSSPWVMLQSYCLGDMGQLALHWRNRLLHCSTLSILYLSEALCALLKSAVDKSVANGFISASSLA